MRINLFLKLNSTLPRGTEQNVALPKQKHLEMNIVVGR